MEEFLNMAVLMFVTSVLLNLLTDLEYSPKQEHLNVIKVHVNYCLLCFPGIFVGRIDDLPGCS